MHKLCFLQTDNEEVEPKPYKTWGNLLPQIMTILSSLSTPGISLIPGSILFVNLQKCRYFLLPQEENIFFKKMLFFWSLLHLLVHIKFFWSQMAFALITSNSIAPNNLCINHFQLSMSKDLFNLQLFSIQIFISGKH